MIKDLIQARLDAGGRILFGVAAVSVHDVESNAPRVRYVKDGAAPQSRGG